MSALLEILAVIDGKLQRIEERLTNMEVLHAKNSLDLAHHISRTDKLEESIKPLTNATVWWGVSGKLMAYLAGFVGVVYTVLRILAQFRH